MIGVPSTQDFMTAVQHNLIPNIKVTVQDIKNAELIFGKDLGAIQGKSTRSRPAPVLSDHIELPPDVLTAHNRITLGADIFFVNKIPFFITVSHNIKFITGDRLQNRKETTIVSALLKVCALYSKRGFTVSRCNMDNEFECLKDSLVERRHGVQLNICAPDEHVPEIERNIRTVKERIRSISSTLPFSALPELMVVHLVMFCILWLNFFPPKGGISNTLSPEAIVKGRSVDSKLHCRIPFGGYSQVHQGSDNTNNALVNRTVGAIALGPTGNAQGTYKFMSMLTGKLIKGRSFITLPMPSDIIRQIKFLATQQPDTVTFGDRVGNTTISDLDTNEVEDEDDDDFDDYASARADFDDEDDSLIFDEENNEGDLEVTQATENILPEILDENQFGENIQSGEIINGGELQHGSQNFPTFEDGSTNTASINIDSIHDSRSEDPRSADSRSGEESEFLEIPDDDDIAAGVNQSIVDIADEFEGHLDDPNIDTPPSSPTNYVTRTGRVIKARKFLMHSHLGNATSFLGKVDEMDGNPDLWSPSTQSTFGMKNQQARDHCFSYSNTDHSAMT